MKKILLVGTAVLALAACNKEKVSGNSELLATKTNASLQVGFAAVGTKADLTSYAGTEGENAVSKIVLYGETANSNNYREFTATSTPKLKKLTDALYTLDDAFATTSGQRYMGVTLNLGGSYYGEATSATVKPEVSVTQVGHVVTMDSSNPAKGTASSMAMSSVVKAANGNGLKNLNVADNISRNTAASGTTTAENVFPFDVERILAKVSVIGTNESEQITVKARAANDNNTIGTLSELSFAVSNLSSTFYVFPQFNSAGDKRVDTYMTPAGTPYNETTFKAKYVPLGNLSTLVAPDAGTYYKLSHPYGAKKVGRAATDVTSENAGTLQACYVPENIELTEAKTSAQKTLSWGNVTYIKVYGKFTLKAGTVVKYLNGSQALTDGTPANLPSDGTFYVGEVDKLIYASKEAAKKATGTAANQNAYTYKKGRMGYKVLVNKVLDGEYVTDASVVRNNYYIVRISDVKGMGFNYDPHDPNDPNLPKDSTDPTKPDDGGNNVNDTATYMITRTQILPWTVAVRNETLTY